MKQLAGNTVRRDKMKLGIYRFTDPFGPTIYAVYWGYRGFVWHWK